MRARMYAHAYDCRQIAIGTQDHRKREDSGKAEKSEYIGMIADKGKKV